MYCPTIGSSHAPTGCVATAMGQIMYKHRWPTTGTGQHSYTWNGQTLSADFGSTTYNWQQMTAQYTSSSTTAQKAAVATLMSHLGIACEMGYASGGSSANGTDMMAALIAYFGYDTDIRAIRPDYHGEEETVQTIYSELLQGRPVFFSARTIYDEGHAFVGEGIDASGNIYLNWGWGGYCDGYFALSLMDPEGQGTGGAASNEAYTEDICVFTGIKPNAGGSYTPQITIDASLLYSSMRVRKTSSVGFKVRQFKNNGVNSWSGSVYLTVYDEDDNLVGGVSARSGMSLDPNYYFSSDMNFYGSLSSLTPGNYKLGLAVSKSGSSTVYPVYQKNVGMCLKPMTVTADSIFFGDATGEQEPSAQYFTHSKCIVTLSTNQWKVDLNTPNFWETTSMGTDALLRCDIQSAKNTSIVGSYLLDTGNSGDNGTVYASGCTYAEGYYQACYSRTPSQVELTFSDAGNQRLCVDYHIVSSLGTVTGRDTIVRNEQDWWRKEGTNNYDNSSNTNLQLATPMTVAAANSRAASLSAGGTSPIPYLVSGIVSSVATTEEVAAFSGQCSFTITDAGGASGLSCENVQWLNGTSFTSGTEVQVGDTVVMYVKLKKTAQSAITAQGRVYSCKKSILNRKFLVLFLNNNGALLQSDSVQYNHTPVYRGGTPEKANVNAWEIATFTGWSPAIAPVTQNQTYRACYSTSYRSYSITTAAAANGTAAGGGTFEYGTSVQLTATAATGYHFTRWSDGNTDNPRTVIVSADATYTAEFAKNQYTITATASAGGTATGATALYLEEATITATANYGYHFTQWSDGNTDNPRTVIVSGDASYTAEFAKNQYTVTLTVNDASMGSATGEGSYEYLSTVSCAATAAEGYEFVRWSDGSTDNPYSIVITGDMTLQAIFQEIPSALDNAETSPRVEKFFREGILYIRRGNHLYDANGRLIE